MTKYLCKDPERLVQLKNAFPWFTDELIQETLRFKFKDHWESVTFYDPNIGSNEYFSIYKSMFDEQKDPLEPYVWYSQSKWDNNPNNYWVIIKTHTNEYRVLSFACATLSDNIESFMYIKPAYINEDFEGH